MHMVAAPYNPKAADPIGLTQPKAIAWKQSVSCPCYSKHYINLGLRGGGGGGHFSHPVICMEAPG